MYLFWHTLYNVSIPNIQTSLQGVQLTIPITRCRRSAKLQKARLPVHQLQVLRRGNHPLANDQLLFRQPVLDALPGLCSPLGTLAETGVEGPAAVLVLG